MKSFDRWTVDFRCTSCGQSGMATVSEEQQLTFRRRSPRVIEACSPGFVIVSATHPPKSEMMSIQPQILCERCRIIVYGPRHRRAR